jgi:hypothetical protein
MKRLFLLLIITVFTLGCEKEEPPLTDDELGRKGFLERAIEDYHFKIFTTMKDNEPESPYVEYETLIEIVESETLNFALIAEERGLSVIVSSDEDCYNCNEMLYYAYSDMDNIIISEENVDRPNSLSLVLNYSYVEE